MKMSIEGKGGGGGGATSNSGNNMEKGKQFGNTKSGGGSAMFSWLETLEKEFDKAFVDLDLLLGEVDADQAEITFEGRQKMTALSAAFAQLIHKSQTIFQNNCKLEVSDSCSVFSLYSFSRFLRVKWVTFFWNRNDQEILKRS